MIISEQINANVVRIKSDVGLPIQRQTDGAIFSEAVQNANSRVSYIEIGAADE